jgi:hypothetical protein
MYLLGLICHEILINFQVAAPLRGKLRSKIKLIFFGVIKRKQVDLLELLNIAGLSELMDYPDFQTSRTIKTFRNCGPSCLLEPFGFLDFFGTPIQRSLDRSIFDLVYLNVHKSFLIFFIRINSITHTFKMEYVLTCINSTTYTNH